VWPHLRTYLTQVGMNETEVLRTTATFDRPTLLWTWATLHANGTDHGWHAHAGTMISGIYFIRTPPGSGPLSFADPRQLHQESVDEARPLEEPFKCNTFEVYPQAGDLVLFPPWLLHMVQQTDVADERISIAFNLHGEDDRDAWGTTAALHTDGVTASTRTQSKEAGTNQVIGVHKCRTSGMPSPQTAMDGLCESEAAYELDDEATMFDNMDSNSDGVISKQEFSDWYDRQREGN